jgi:hypothetical protein
VADLQRRGGLPTPQGPLVNPDGSPTAVWVLLLRQILQLAGLLQQVVFGNTDVRGRATLTVVATAPMLLSTEDVGFLVWLSDYNHVVRWTGTAWQFAIGDAGNGYFVAVPAGVVLGVGWHLCDGSTVPSVVLGATITTANVVLPTVANQYYRQ